MINLDRRIEEGGMSTTDSPFIAFASEEEVISFKYCLPCDYVRRSGK